MTALDRVSLLAASALHPKPSNAFAPHRRGWLRIVSQSRYIPPIRHCSASLHLNPFRGFSRMVELFPDRLPFVLPLRAGPGHGDVKNGMRLLLSLLHSEAISQTSRSFGRGEGLQR